MDFASPPPSREVRALAPSAGAAAAEAASQRERLPGARVRRQLVRQIVHGRSQSSSVSRSPSPVLALAFEEGGVGEPQDLEQQGQGEDSEEEEDEEVVVRHRVRRSILHTVNRNRREDEMMTAAAWTKPLFMGQGLRKHLMELEALFILSASRLGRVPQPGEHAFVVLDETKKILALQSMSEPIRDRLLRAEQNATSDLRMEIDGGVGSCDVASVRHRPGQVLPRRDRPSDRGG